MKKITAALLAALFLSACSQYPQPNHSSKPSNESEAAVQTQDIANQDISEVTAEDIPAEQDFSANEAVQSTDEPPVELHLSEQFNENAAKIGNGNYLQLDVSAISDQVTIHNVTVNRGNTCKPHLWYSRWPGHGTLKFGQTVSAHILCNFHSIKEVIVDTDLGSYTFNF